MIKKVLRNAVFLGLAMTAVVGTAQAHGFGGGFHGGGYHGGGFHGGHGYNGFHGHRWYFGSYGYPYSYGGCSEGEYGGRRFCD